MTTISGSHDNDKWKFILVGLLVFGLCILGIGKCQAQCYDKITYSLDSSFAVTNTTLKQHRWEPVKVIALYSASIIFNAIGDGLNDNNQKISGHLWNAASIATLLVSPYVFNYQKDKWYIYLASYTFIRASIFDPVYNISRHKPFNYLDRNSSVTDRIWDNWGGSDNFTRGVFLTVGILLPIDKL